jgi:protein-arginine kinase activator protein McsA
MNGVKVMTEKCNICEGFGCSKEAKICIQVCGGEKGDIILYLCKSCAKMFNDPLKCDSNSNKKTLEQQVERPARSNAPDHMQSYQQHGVLFDD